MSNRLFNALSDNQPYAALSMGMETSSARVQTTANARVNFNALEMFNSAPAPLPRTNGGWPF